MEKVDENLMRRVLQCPVSTPKEMLYLELGVSPIRSIIKSRRLNFLHYILHEDKQSLMYSFLQAQLDQPTRQDWGQTVLADIEEFGLSLTLNRIERMSQFTFQNLVKEKQKKYTLEYLNNVKSTHSKVLHISHNKLQMADYLMPNGILNSEAKFMFNTRC